MNVYGITKEQRRETARRKCQELHGRLDNGYRYCDQHADDVKAQDFLLGMLKDYEKWYFEWVILGGNESEGYFKF